MALTGQGAAAKNFLLPEQSIIKPSHLYKRESEACLPIQHDIIFLLQSGDTYERE